MWTEVRGSDSILLVRALEWSLFLVKIGSTFFFFKCQAHMRKQSVTGICDFALISEVGGGTHFGITKAR